MLRNTRSSRLEARGGDTVLLRPPTRLSIQGVTVAAAVEQANRRAALAQAGGCREIDIVVRAQNHAVIVLGARRADKAGANIPKHALGLTVERMAVPTAAASFDAHHVTAADHCPVADRRHTPFPGPAGIDHERPTPPALPPLTPQGGCSMPSMRTEMTASGASSSNADDAAAAAPATGSAAIG